MPISFSRTLQDEGVVAPRGVGGAEEGRVVVVEGGVEGGDVGRAKRTGWGRGGDSVVTDVTTAKLQTWKTHWTSRIFLVLRLLPLSSRGLPLPECERVTQGLYPVNLGL